MILAEKLKQLRKHQGLSQEQLSDICGVSRQSISKWEADIALPETEKLLQLSSLFNISLDVMLKDELDIDSSIEVHTCGESMESNGTGIYSGILIKESITDETVLDYLLVNKVELWKTDDCPKYWTVLYFTSHTKDFPQRISKSLKSDKETGSWFCDFKRGNMKFIVFTNMILQYCIGNIKEKERVIIECEKYGIARTQMNWEE